MKKRENFESINFAGMTGVVKSSIDLKKLWQEIKCVLENQKPFYALKNWRKVYKHNSSLFGQIYIKEINEEHHEKRTLTNKFLSSEASRYFKNHLCMERLGVHTPELLLACGRRAWGTWRYSLLVTQALTEFCELPEYCDEHYKNPDFKTDMHNALQELAVLTAKMHKNGYYFSLDARNIFIRKTVKSGQNNLALIDLDHIHHAIAGIMPKRRIKRNLARFKKTLAKLNGSLQYEYTKFLETYTENLVKNQHSGDKHNAR